MHAKEIRERMAQEAVDWSKANWIPFTKNTTNVAVDFGPGEGKRVLWWAGRWPDGSQITGRARVRVDLTPPVIVITSPTVRVTSRRMIQLEGYGSEQLLSIYYDVINASKRLTNVQGFVTRQVDDPHEFGHVTNYFTCFDISLAPGNNEIVLRCKDLAGNVSTNRYTYVLKLDDDKTPPVVSLSWPRDGQRIAGTNFTAQGSLDDYTARVTAVAISGESTKAVTGMVERNGHFWLDNIPLRPGANHLAITATDAAGNAAHTNIVVFQSPGILMMNPVPKEELLRAEVKVTGTVSPANQAVWVNGVRAQVKPDGTWMADKVPVQSPNGGTAVFDLSATPTSGNAGSGAATTAANPNRLLSAQAELGTNAIVLNAQRPACGVFNLHLTGRPGTEFVLEASTNLLNWVPVLTNSLGLGTFDYADPDAAGYQCRFFRVMEVR